MDGNFSHCNNCGGRHDEEDCKMKSRVKPEDKYTFKFYMIHEGGHRFLTFNPPLEIDCYRTEDNPDAFDCYFDFGMSYRQGTNGCFLERVEGEENRLRKSIEFELFHSFFHYELDPNYGLLNWALYGNLKDRTTKQEFYY